MKTLTIMICSVLLIGCATATEADRALNHQNVGAAKAAMAMLAGASGDPMAALAALTVVVSDIQKNSEQIQMSLGGPPKEPKPYSTEESEKARKAAKESHETPWWKVALGGLGSFMLGLITSGRLASVFPFLAGPFGAALSLLTGGIARVREKAATTGGTISVEGQDGLLSMLKAEASTNPAAHALIKALAHKAEEKLGLKL